MCGKTSHGWCCCEGARVDYWANFQTQYNKDGLAEDIGRIVKRRLGNPSGKARHAAYYGPCLRHHADLENILFYNTGVWGLGVVTPGNPYIRFEHCRERPLNRPPEDNFTHCYSYWLGETDEYPWFKGQKPEVVIDVRLRDPKDLDNSKIVWYAVKDQVKRECTKPGTAMNGSPIKDEERLGISATISVPAPTRKRGYHVKPIFDGIAAALHYWDDKEKKDEIIRKLDGVSRVVGVPVDDLYRLFTNEQGCLLGPKMIMDNRKKPQLNPDDHRIGAGELILSKNNPSDTALCVRIYRLPTAAECRGAQ
jgi:hypothetical protein